MPSTCEFQFSKPNAVYYNGETVSGTIIFTTTRPKNVTEINIIFCGQAKVSWDETERRRRSDGTVEYNSVRFRASELYADSCVNVLGEGILPEGTHNYAFEIDLPLNCPTSLEGSYGHIRYELTLKLKRPFHFDNMFSKPITVINSRDLNLDAIYRNPTVTEEIYGTCCWPFSGGSIITTLTIPYGGYAIGQRFKFSLRVDNQTMYDVEGYNVEFIRKTKFTAHTPYRKIRENKTALVNKLYDDSCLRLTKRTYEHDFAIIPTPPSCGEGIISVYYYLKITLNMWSCTKNKTITAPIIIGTVAVRESIDTEESLEIDRLIATTACIEPTVATAPIDPTAPELPPYEESGNDLPPSYNNLGPPSFEEATRCSSTFIDVDKDVYNRHIGWRPLYPSYSQTDE